MKAVITGVVLARNEESNIVDCLKALRPHAPEIILIDMESDDRTVELARPHVRKILTHPLVSNFDSSRNIAIEHAEFRWLWFVDADERIPENTGAMVTDLIRHQGSEFEAINIPFKSYFAGRWMQHCGWWPGYTMPRVLKKGAFQFSEQLHGGVEVNGRQIYIAPDEETGIEHYSYKDIEHYLEKLNRYTSTEASQMAKEGKTFDWQDSFRHMVHDLWVYYEANPGGLDGEHGWILSWLSGQYRWLSHAKLLDQNPNGKPPNIPSNLDEVVRLFDDELTHLRSRSPQLPLGIHWRSPIWDPSGYADEGRTLVKALSLGDRELSVSEIAWSDKTCELPKPETALLKALLNSRRPKYSAAITDCIPTLVQPDPKASLNILRTTFETDRIPKEWLPHIAAFDEVWVISKHNYDAFLRSGVAPERLRRVPSCVDTNYFTPDGPKQNLPEHCNERFVFLSIFDWQLRKGWDVLLHAYCDQFSSEDGATLLLKFTRGHGHPMSVVEAQANEVLKEVGTSLADRPDIVLWDEMLTGSEVASLYRSVDVFVLASRGEGWGRPYIEAMASGLPVIGTAGSGNIDFMSDANSFLVPAELVDVPDVAADEIPPYRGHRWFEPDEIALGQLMHKAFEDRRTRNKKAKQALNDIRENFGLESACESFETALREAEQRFSTYQVPEVSEDQIRVAWEGELFACHSFANVNEKLALQFIEDHSLAFSLERVQFNPVYDENVSYSNKLKPFIERGLTDPQVVVRHAYPPNFQPTGDTAWVHIQPWEFGHLPEDWVDPIQNHVDEVWAPSSYVKRVYERSGIPSEKVQVIPWGVDPDVFHGEVAPLLLPTEKSFKFLYVGGTIPRKGFDILLEAYLQEFAPDDDVCLVVKDLGSQTFYRVENGREAAIAARDDASKPELLYLDQNLTDGQLAGLYASCDCLVVPYRGEGFGLPILEAMACGVAPMVPTGGASDDFVDEKVGYLLPSQEVEDTAADMNLVGPPMVLSINVQDVMAMMRKAVKQHQETSALGVAAAKSVAGKYTWQNTAKLMSERLHQVVARKKEELADQNNNGEANSPNGSILSACLTVKNCEETLADCLARIRPFVDQMVVADRGSKDKSVEVAKRYGADIVQGKPRSALKKLRKDCLEQAHSSWIVWLNECDRLDDRDAEKMKSMLEKLPEDIAEISMAVSHSRIFDDAGKPLDRLQFARRNGSTVEIGVEA